MILKGQSGSKGVKLTVYWGTTTLRVLHSYFLYVLELNHKNYFMIEEWEVPSDQEIHFKLDKAPQKEERKLGCVDSENDFYPAVSVFL